MINQTYAYTMAATDRKQRRRAGVGWGRDGEEVVEDFPNCEAVVQDCEGLSNL